jgi:hypothetical protein
MVKCVCYAGLRIHWFHDPGAIIRNDSITIGWASLVGVGHIMLCTVCCAMAGVLTLYYKSLETTPTMLKMDNISSRPYMGIMTCNALAFSYIKTLR